MAIFGWAIFALLACYITLAVGVATLFHCGSGNKPGGEVILGWVIAAVMIFVAYNSCPFTIQVTQ